MVDIRAPSSIRVSAVSGNGAVFTSGRSAITIVDQAPKVVRKARSAKPNTNASPTGSFPSS